MQVSSTWWRNLKESALQIHYLENPRELLTAMSSLSNEELEVCADTMVESMLPINPSRTKAPG